MHGTVLTRAARGVFGALLIAVGFLALTPEPPRSLDTGWDKTNHLVAFAALGALASVAFPAARGRAAAALLGYGGAIELLQRKVPGRSAEWSDWFADAIGLGLGAGAGAAARAWLRRRRR